jgi:signal transduction histidine kinase
MNVSNILARKGRRVFTVKSSATLATAANLLTKRQIGALVVTGTGGRVSGIISERDIVQALGRKGGVALGLPIAKAMTNALVTCDESSTVHQIMNKMTRGRFRHMPVMQRGNLAGLVSMGDAVKFRLGRLEDALTNIETAIASIAHEVRQPLTAIAANGGAASRYLQKVPVDIVEVRAALNRMIEECHRTSAVFESIRALFGSRNQRKQLLNLNEVVLEVLESLRGELDDCDVTTYPDLMVELPLIDGHRTQLQEVIANLIHNAVQAMSGTTNRARVLKVTSKLHRRNAIEVSIEDSGPGISQKRLRKMFDAFVTTKPTGMGLGLAICKMIVERHGGNISAHSDGNSGTRMRIILPISGR